MSAIIGALLTVGAFLLWPSRRSPPELLLALGRSGASPARDDPASTGAPTYRPGASGAHGATMLPRTAAQPERWPGRLPPLGRALLRLPAARRRKASEIHEVLGFLDAIVPALRAGLAPSVVVRSVMDDSAFASSSPAAEQLRAAAAAGRPLGPLWSAWGMSARNADIGLVAQAWILSEVAGAPLADSVELAAELVRQRLGWRRRIELNVAGPRATMNVLCLLPLAGPLLALLFGIGPAELYAGTAVASASVVTGIALLLAGRWWCGRMIGALTRPQAVE